MSRRRIQAAIDIGSYSVHLLVAEVRGRAIRPLHDESAHLGLGREIDEAGDLGAVRAKLVETMTSFAMRAWSLEASSITIVATDPFRRAPDAEAARAEIIAATGVDVAILTHEDEALVALIGVQAGRPILRNTVVVDVGGGSTEVLIAGPALEPVAAGLPLGAARLTGLLVEHDPPTQRELVALLGHSLTAMAAAPDVDQAELIAVGGTARSLLRVGPKLSSRTLTHRRVRHALDLMAAAPAEASAERFGIRVSRARVLSAGAAILLGALDRYRLDRLRGAAGGLREGMILAASREGPRWRSELRALARGWEA
jgi:exopolyphosphatase/guanosine-5'-triphosphate,3'-diphosphate pyrophosphatase